MKNLVVFFEIPSLDFHRAVKFYETIFGLKLPVMECEKEKMAFFPEENGKCPGAISYSDDFKPSNEGVLVSLNVDEINKTLTMIEKNGGKTIRPKTKIQAEGRGYFAIFIDCEGNRVGLYSDK
ncbi:MAG: VOC family protein [Bacteroidales bacterium]|nr:VOC family protein [Bacteroidales bacterium]